MPSSAKARRIAADEINRMGTEGLIVEAGSGWGTLAIHLIRRCEGWRLIGLENSPIPLWISRLYSRLLFSKNEASRDRISFIQGDVYTYLYEEADVVVCYLYPGAMKKLSRILEQRLASKGRIISICFALPNWQPTRVITCKDLFHTKIYVYSAPSLKILPSKI